MDFVFSDQPAAFWIMYMFFSLLAGIFLFIGLPLFALWAGRSVSRRKLYTNMFVYTVVMLLLFLLTCYSVMADSGYTAADIWQDMEKSDIFLFVACSAIPYLLSPVCCIIMCKTNKVDVKVPLRYRFTPAVKAVVVEVDSKAAVEYNGKHYEFSKPLKFNLRDRVKVLVKEDEDRCYLK